MKYCIIICIINTFNCNTSKLVVGEQLTMFVQIMNTSKPSMNSGNEFSFKNSEKHECTNEECAQASFRIQNNMNLQTLPCTDFYKFTCGDFVEQRLIAQDEYIVNSMSETMFNHQRNLKQLIENINPVNFTAPFNSAKRFYSDCVNLDYNNYNVLQKMHHRINVRNGWPLLMDVESLEIWDDKNFHWLSVVIASFREGSSADYLFKLSIEVDPFIPQEYVLIVDQPELEFSKETFDKFPDMPYEIEQYYSYMIDVALIFGADKDRATIDLLATLQFEYELSKILLSKEEVLNLYDRKARFGLVELHQFTPNIDWFMIFNSYVHESTNMQYNDIIIVKSIQYLEELDKLILNTPREVVTNYLIWKLISQSAQFINDELRVLTSEYRKMFTGELQRKPTWVECVEVTKQFFPGIINALVSYHSRPEILKRATAEIIDQMKLSMVEGLNLTWRDNHTKDLVVDKINSITYNFGFPMQYSDGQKLLEYYNVLMYSGNYFDSMLLMTRQHREFYVKRYKNSDPFYYDWIKRLNMPLYDVSYDYVKNEISLGVGILNILTIDKNFPYYGRFAGIGVIIGRLFSKIYDEIGRSFVADGTFHTWCSQHCGKTFSEQAQCIIAQYNNFMQKTNSSRLGNRTEYQNIADLHGVNIAYMTYMRWIYKNGEEIKLPGLNFTNNQMFWIWYGNMHCTKFRPEAYEMFIETGDDVDPKFRVNAPLVNTPYFGIDFNCDDINYMDIKNKCEFF